MLGVVIIVEKENIGFTSGSTCESNYSCEGDTVGGKIIPATNDRYFSQEAARPHSSKPSSINVGQPIYLSQIKNLNADIVKDTERRRMTPTHTTIDAKVGEEIFFDNTMGRIKANLKHLVNFEIAAKKHDTMQVLHMQEAYDQLNRSQAACVCVQRCTCNARTLQAGCTCYGRCNCDCDRVADDCACDNRCGSECSSRGTITCGCWNRCGCETDCRNRCACNVDSIDSLKCYSDTCPSDNSSCSGHTGGSCTNRTAGAVACPDQIPNGYCHCNTRCNCNARTSVSCVCNIRRVGCVDDIRKGYDCGAYTEPAECGAYVAG